MPSEVLHTYCFLAFLSSTLWARILRQQRQREAGWAQQEGRAGEAAVSAFPKIFFKDIFLFLFSFLHHSGMRQPEGWADLLPSLTLRIPRGEPRNWEPVRGWEVPGKCARDAGRTLYPGTYSDRNLQRNTDTAPGLPGALCVLPYLIVTTPLPGTYIGISQRRKLRRVAKAPQESLR